MDSSGVCVDGVGELWGGVGGEFLVAIFSGSSGHHNIFL